MSRLPALLRPLEPDLLGSHVRGGPHRDAGRGEFAGSRLVLARPKSVILGIKQVSDSFNAAPGEPALVIGASSSFWRRTLPGLRSR